MGRSRRTVLEQHPSDLAVYPNHLHFNLNVKVQILIHQVWGGTWDSACLKGSQRMLMLLAHCVQILVRSMLPTYGESSIQRGMWPSSASCTSPLSAEVGSCPISRSILSALHSPHCSFLRQPPQWWDYRRFRFSSFYFLYLQRFYQGSYMSCKIRKNWVNLFLT